ncbi:uncharacterized protein LOC108835455 [Raphanus sativus]|uniref:Uncharacterized protein LOC108835455 n=1 Tax=Raphanus sativus TaxID=3726 RepID=A0A9W3D7T8_RAPSA|nr:uncharacterized protein LOC108835455 [Raphanus sativus]
MKKQSSSRSQRGSRGIKGKHVVQICVLLGVCIWFIYQVKYSHDKKKEFFDADGKKSTALLESEEGMVKLGRKDLLPGYHSQEEKEKHVEGDEEDEEEETEKESKSNVENSTHEEEEDEEDKNKQGEEVVEEDEEENKHEEEEEDVIDEQDQSKDDELLQEEKENGSNERETETNHADETDMTVHEAREEHYKADDASSAVSHESRILNTERLKESFGNSTGPAQENGSNATIIEVEVQKEPVLKLGEAVEKTTTEVKEGDSESSNSESAVPEASGFVQNETKTMQERSQEHDRTEDGAPPSGSSDLQTLVQLEQTGNETDANVTVSANITNTSSIQDDEFRNSTSVSSLIENTSGSNTTEEKESSRYEGDDETEDKESSEHLPQSKRRKQMILLKAQCCKKREKLSLIHKLCRI